LLRACICYS